VYQRSCVFYALLGTSMHLQIGPTSLVRRPITPGCACECAS
jgi:hypothetical protein